MKRNKKAISMNKETTLKKLKVFAEQADTNFSGLKKVL